MDRTWLRLFRQTGLNIVDSCGGYSLSSTVMDTIVVSKVGQRYIISVDQAQAGFADYHDEQGNRIFTHTEIAPEFAGRGLGKKLVSAALADTAADGLTAIGQCSFVASCIAQQR